LILFLLTATFVCVTKVPSRLSQQLGSDLVGEAGSRVMPSYRSSCGVWMGTKMMPAYSTSSRTSLANRSRLACRMGSIEGSPFGPVSL
jgi:hypothetical protein